MTPSTRPRSLLLPLLLPLVLTVLAEALALQQPSTVLHLPAALPPAAEPFSVPSVVVEPVIVNYTRFVSTHAVDETALLSSFAYSSEVADDAAHKHTLLHTLHLTRPATASDNPLVIHNVSFTRSTDSPASSAHPACVSDALQQHGLRLSDCHALPVELLSTERVSLRLAYRPTATALPVAYYILVHTNEALYFASVHLLLPSSLAAYQRADFVPATVRGSAAPPGGVVLSLLTSLPLLLAVAVSVLLFFAQTGQLHSSSVAALIQPLPALAAVHATLKPYLYPLEAPANSQQPQAAVVSAPPAAHAHASHQPSPMHALLRRRAAIGSPAPTALPTAFAAAPLSALTDPLPPQSPDSQATDSAPSSPFVTSLPELPDSALDLTQLTFHHHKSLSVGTGEAMFKEAERELRRKRRSGKQAEAGAGQEEKRAELGGVSEPDIVSPPQTRRTMSVGSSGPHFFRFDLMPKEADERSSDGSRVGSDSSSSTTASHSEDDEERSRSDSCKLSPAQPQQRGVEAVSAVPSASSRPLDASAQPFTPRSAVAARVESKSPQSHSGQSAARPFRPAPTSYTPRASFYASHRAAVSPRPLYSSGGHDVLPHAYRTHEDKEWRPAPSPSMPDASTPTTAAYPSYSSPRHSTLPPRNMYPHPVSPAHSTFHAHFQQQQQQQQHLQPPHLSASFRSSTQSAPSGYLSPRISSLPVSYSPLLQPLPDFAPPASQQPIIVYDHTDSVGPTASVSSPIHRPKLAHLILPKSPDCGPSLAPISPQAFRANASPSHRFLHVGGAGVVRDSKWDAGNDAESGDWPDTRPPPHRRQLTPFTVSVSPSARRSKEEPLYEISEEESPQQPASVWSTVRSSAIDAGDFSNNAMFPYHSYPARPLAPIASVSSPLSWSSPNSPLSHSFALPSLSPSAASSPVTSPLLTSGDAVADDEDLMDLRAMEEETSRGGVLGDVAGGVRDEDDVSGLADALGALGRARVLHSIQLSLAQSRSATAPNVDADTSGKENVDAFSSVLDALVGTQKG